MLVLLLRSHPLLCPVTTMAITKPAVTPSPSPAAAAPIVIIIIIILSLVRIKSKLFKGFQSPLSSYPAYFSGLISDHLSPCMQHSKQIKLRPSEISRSLSVSYFGTYCSFYIEHSYSSSPCLGMTSQKLSMIPKFWAK